MFDLIEEELSKEKGPAQEGPVFSEETNPIYTMPATFRRAMPKASSGKLIGIIFGSLFGLAAIGTGVFLYLSSQKPAPVTPPVQPQAEQPPSTNTSSQTPQPSTASTEQPSAQAQTPTTPSASAQGSLPLPTGQAGGATSQQLVSNGSSNGTAGQSVQQTTSPQAQTIQPVEEKKSASPVLGIDTDQDGLTDAEERLYTTDPNKTDTDGDGFSDGNEVKNLFNPLKSEVRLDVSGLVNTYTNQTFKYSLFYPSSWVAKAVDHNTDREVMISSATGEFFTISVQDNPNKLSPVDWYTTVIAPGGDATHLQSFAYNTWSGVMTEDSLTVYLTRNDKNPQTQGLMYVIKYSVNTKNEINFITTFQMMLRSFVFTDLSFVK